MGSDQFDQSDLPIVVIDKATGVRCFYKGTTDVVSFL